VPVEWPAPLSSCNPIVTKRRWILEMSDRKLISLSDVG
jgi:hypothetical protein